MTPAEEEQLSAYLDGEANPAERESVERWLRDSSEAKQTLDEFERLGQAVRLLAGSSREHESVRPMVPPPTAPGETSFGATVMARIRAAAVTSRGRSEAGLGRDDLVPPDGQTDFVAEERELTSELGTQSTVDRAEATDSGPVLDPAARNQTRGRWLGFVAAIGTTALALSLVWVVLSPALRPDPMLSRRDDARYDGTTMSKASPAESFAAPMSETVEDSTFAGSVQRERFLAQDQSLAEIRQQREDESFGSNSASMASPAAGRLMLAPTEPRTYPNPHDPTTTAPNQSASSDLARSQAISPSDALRKGLAGEDTGLSGTPASRAEGRVRPAAPDAAAPMRLGESGPSLFASGEGGPPTNTPSPSVSSPLQPSDSPGQAGILDGVEPYFGSGADTFERMVPHPMLRDGGAEGNGAMGMSMEGMSMEGMGVEGMEGMVQPYGTDLRRGLGPGRDAKSEGVEGSGIEPERLPVPTPEMDMPASSADDASRETRSLELAAPQALMKDQSDADRSGGRFGKTADSPSPDADPLSRRPVAPPVAPLAAGGVMAPPAPAPAPIMRGASRPEPLGRRGEDADGNVVTPSLGPLTLAWKDNVLTIASRSLPGERIEVLYLEAVCRPGGHDRDWSETTIAHETRLLSDSPDEQRLRLATQVSDGTRLDHTITTDDAGVVLEIVASNPTDQPGQAQWAQPCIRVDRFTGGTQDSYLSQCFVYLDGTPHKLPTRPWATEGRYTPGQVWAAPGVAREDTNPRPLAAAVPSPGLIGCESADGRWLMAVVFEPYHELFQGVITCLHSDFAIGPLAPGERRTIRGRIYLLPNDQQRLLSRYREEFRSLADEASESSRERE